LVVFVVVVITIAVEQRGLAARWRLLLARCLGGKRPRVVAHGGGNNSSSFVVSLRSFR
jgi:hypothetical protein